MKRNDLRNDSFTLLCVWVLILTAWLRVWYDHGMVLPGIAWSTLGVILTLMVICAAWLIYRRIQIGRLDRLPWYMVIGPHSAGKATLLHQSGLRHGSGKGRSFLACSSVTINQVGGFLLGTFDTDKTARQEYFGDLEQFLGGRTLCGILVALPVDHMRDSTYSQREAEALQTYLADLSERFKINLPVYLILTKTDLLQGFRSFFAELSDQERLQAWGISFTGTPQKQADIASILDAEWQILARALDQRRLQSMVLDPAVNRDSYLFPQHVAELYPKLATFVKTAFQKLPMGDLPMLRGVYFSSAGQPDSTPVRSYFIHDLLARIIVGDRGLAYPTSRKYRSVWLLRSGFCLLAFVIGGSMVWVWF